MRSQGSSVMELNSTAVFSRQLGKLKQAHILTIFCQKISPVSIMTASKEPAAGYPGFGLPLQYSPDDDWSRRYNGTYPLGIHEGNAGCDSGMIQIREVAMMSVMDRLTDKPDWHRKVWNEEIVTKWRREALEIPDEELWDLATRNKSLQQRMTLDRNGNMVPVRSRGLPDGPTPEGIMNEATFDCCIQELREKAKHFEKTGIIPTLDAFASVAKSDSIVPADLQVELKKAFDRLEGDQAANPDWHPGSDDKVLDLVHPSMYLLAYGRTRVLDKELVGVEGAVEAWAGKGNVIPDRSPEQNSLPMGYNRFIGNSSRASQSKSFWSGQYQWLPSNMCFQQDGSLKFTSYINNLHPTRYPEIYKGIEILATKALPMWDQCLAVNAAYGKKTGPGRLESRLPFKGVDDEVTPGIWTPDNYSREAMGDLADKPVNWKESNMPDGPDDDDDDGDDSSQDEEEKLRSVWEAIRKPIFPDPEFSHMDYEPKIGSRLAEKYKDSGLQVIVKMASIKLTPEKPEFAGGAWHVEGQMNERIVGTALYYLDSENITDSCLEFRMPTNATYMEDQMISNIGSDAYHWMELAYGVRLGQDHAAGLQNYGTVETRQGRLLTFPNVFQHRVPSFRLQDSTKPGYRRFIALWLVDPNIRIINTGMVPPQRLDWWLEAVLESPEMVAKLPLDVVEVLLQRGVGPGTGNEGFNQLPPEIITMITEHLKVEGIPMGEEEAKQHRLKVMEIRSAFEENAESGWQSRTYGFCEH
ncbi:hypothetical protein PspLS_00257 [Pyricularia sp. CBS 133598]|nr:hypothetical protein PspLS_00257 [Pyricularia sp. CBS 133598]